MWLRNPGALSFNQGLCWDWTEAGLGMVLLLAHEADGSMLFLVDCQPEGLSFFPDSGWRPLEEAG